MQTICSMRVGNRKLIIKLLWPNEKQKLMFHTQGRYFLHLNNCAGWLIFTTMITNECLFKSNMNSIFFLLLIDLCAFCIMVA